MEPPRPDVPSGGGWLRAGWRILLFLALYVGLVALLATALSFGWASPPEWTAQAAALVAAVAAGWILLARLDQLPPSTLGFPLGRAALPLSLRGLGLGSALIGAAVLMLVAIGSVRWMPDAGDAASYLRMLLGSFAFFALAAAGEEALFRGYPFQALVTGIGAWPATLLSSALFSLAHVPNPEVGTLALVNIFLAGVLLALAYLRTRSLWFATGVHLGWNWTMASLLDFPVSGWVRDTPLYEVVERGPTLLTGGAFGPEAGLAATAVLLLGCGWLARQPSAAREEQGDTAALLG